VVPEGSDAVDAGSDTTGEEDDKEEGMLAVESGLGASTGAVGWLDPKGHNDSDLEAPEATPKVFPYMGANRGRALLRPRRAAEVVFHCGEDWLSRCTWENWRLGMRHAGVDVFGCSGQYIHSLPNRRSRWGGNGTGRARGGHTCLEPATHCRSPEAGRKLETPLLGNMANGERSPQGSSCLEV
jgi:hypothetical protein